MGLTLAQAQALLAEYLAAESAILKGQSYSIKDRTLTRASLSAVQRERKRLSDLVDQLSGKGSIRVRRVVPRTA